jgi:hypothetical protein
MLQMYYQIYNIIIKIKLNKLYKYLYQLNKNDIIEYFEVIDNK